jgi:tetratricopeptide (TPR) repeat protein
MTPPGFFEMLEARVQEAEDHFRRGEFGPAVEIYKDLLAQRLSSRLEGASRFLAADLVIMERLADLSVFFGAFAVADDILAAMVALNEESGNRYGADYALLKRIHLALGHGRLRYAYELLQRMESSTGDIGAIEFTSTGLVRWEQERAWPDLTGEARAVLLSRLYLVLGWLLAALGHYEEALAALERGLLHVGKEEPDLAQQAMIPLRLLLAGTLLEKGDLTEARVQLAGLAADINDLRQPGFYVRWQELSGQLSLIRGEFGTALRRFRQVLETCYGRGFHQAVVRAALNLAHVLILVNQTRAAKEMLLEVKARATELGDETSQIRAALLLRVAEARGHSLADGVPVAPSVFEMRGRRSSPRHADDAVGQERPFDLPQATSYLTFFEDRALSVHWHLARQDPVAAAHLLSAMKEIFGSTDSVLIRLRLRVLEGMVAYYQNNLTQAEATLNPLRSTLRTLELKPELWQVQRILGWCWARLSHPLQEQHALAEDTQALLGEMSGSLCGSDRAIYLLNKWTADEEYIAREIDQLVSLRTRLAESPWFRRPFQRWRMMKRVNTLIAHIEWYRGTLVERTLQRRDVRVSQPIAGPALWRRLLMYPRQSATLSFLVLPDRVLLIWARRLSVDFAVSPSTRIEVRDLVQRWHEGIGEGNGRRDSLPLPRDALPLRPVEDSAGQRRQVAQRLAEQLHIPYFLESLPRRIRALRIIPDDSLHGFPFAAILHNGVPLIERYALSVAFDWNSRGPAALPPCGKEALVVGVSRGAHQYKPLPGVPAELDQVERWYGYHGLSTRRLMDDSARKSALCNCLGNARLLHIACHGTFEPDQPDRSGMVLIPNPERVEILSLRELSEMDLTKLRHATLSSCWSADSFILPGRWIISLPETLWRCGVQSILGCLWQVDDRLASTFMARFYDYLDKWPRDEALRRTQLDCLHGRLPECMSTDTADPLCWAGFNLYGSPGPLRL